MTKENYTAKNLTRRSLSFKRAKEARAKRQKVNGAFGNSLPNTFNELAEGTTGWRPPS